MQRPSWTAGEVGRARPAPPTTGAPARALAARALADWPELGRALVAGRAFLRRAVAHLAAVGIDQFLDLGAGLPSGTDARVTARHAHPEARVVGVDADGAIARRADALLADDPGAAVVHADALDVDAVLTAPAVTRLLDLRRPVGVLAVGWLHAVDDAADPAGAFGRYREALAPGSHVVLGHADVDPADGDTLYRRAGTPLVPRSPGEVAALLDGYEILAPGVVPPTRWRPDTPDPHAGPDTDLPGGPDRRTGLVAVGRRV